MTIKFDNVTILCDEDENVCECTAAATSAILRNGEINVVLPASWSKDGDRLVGPSCTERRALQRAMLATVPDPSNDPAPLKATRAQRLETMKETLRADLEEREAEFPELREFMRQLVLADGDVPDFLGHIGDAKVKTEVRVRGDYVEISFSHALAPLLEGENPAQHMTLTLQHKDLELINPPAFVDPAVLTWVQNCLKTMTVEEVSDRPKPVAH